MTTFNDIESKGIEAEETPKSTLFTLKNALMVFGIFAALGVATAGSLRLLRGCIKSEQAGEAEENEENDISDQAKSIDLIFDEISSSKPYWIPFFVGNSTYGIIPKQEDNTCTYLNSGTIHKIDGFNPKLSKNKKYVIFWGTYRIHLFDVDSGSIITDRIIPHEDRHFAVTWKNLIIGDLIKRRKNGIARIQRYELDLIESGAFYFYGFKTKCEENQHVRVLAAASDDSKVVYACEDSVPSAIPKSKPIYVKDFNADSNTEDQLVCKIANIPEFVIMSPDDKYTVHFVSKTKTIEVLNVNTREMVVNRQLGDDFYFSTIKNVAFSEDGKLIHVVNVKDSKRKKGATIRTIDFEKLLAWDDDYLGPPLAIEFPRS